MAIFKGGKGRDDTFTGTGRPDRFEFDPLDLTAGDRVVGGDSRAIDVLRFTTAGAIGVSALANVSGIERIELADGSNSIVLTDALVSTAAGDRVQVIGGSGDDMIFAPNLTGANAIDFVAGAGTDYAFTGTGDDSFTFEVATLDHGDWLAASAGDDTLNLLGAGMVTAESLSHVGGVENIVLGDGGISIVVPLALLNTVARFSCTGGNGADLIDLRSAMVPDSWWWGAQLRLSGGAGDDVIYGGLSYAQTIDGGEGADTIVGGGSVVYDRNDASVVAPGGMLLVQGRAKVVLTRSDDQTMGDRNVVKGFVGVDASAATESISAIGTIGSILIGGSGDDKLFGGYSISGGRGADTMIAGRTGTLFSVRAGDLEEGEVIRGGRGADILSVSGNLDFRTVSLSRIEGISYQNSLESSSVKFWASQIKNLDSISASDMAVDIYMRDGDSLPSNIFVHSTVELRVFGSASGDIISGIYYDKVWAGAGDDVISAGGSIYAGSGNDIVKGYAFSNVVSEINGGEGVDTLQLALYLDPSGSYRFDLNRDHLQFATDGVKVRGFEHIDLSSTTEFYEAGKITLLGDVDGNHLTGTRWSDVIRGGGGDDVITGGGGRDRLYGGSGADQFRWTDATRLAPADRLGDFSIGEDTLVFLTKDARNAGFDFAGAAFDTRVEVAERGTNISGADLVIYTAGALSTPDAVERWLGDNGTGLNEGLFVAARDGDGDTVLYYSSRADGFRFVTIAVAELGNLDPVSLTLSDFAFI
jgi:Ca2+-binding RTX toxin-like protein